MNAEQQAWPVARYRFEFEVTAPIRLPEYAGSAMRGAFGAALRRTACMTREPDCKACALYRTCPYTAIFETPAPETHDLQKFSQIPNPYVIEPPPWGERTYEPGQKLAFNMVLIGRARDQLALVTYAWQRAFRHSVGHGQAELLGVRHLADGKETEVYDAVRGRLQPHDQMLRLPVLEARDFRLTFHTPLRLQENGRARRPEELTARQLLMALARRISLLLEFHAAREMKLDFAQLAVAAEAVSFSHDLEWRDWTRYSSRQRQTMQLGGAVGTWVLKAVPRPFVPLLQLGQWLHVGKNATFGLGRYVLELVSCVETSSACGGSSGAVLDRSLIINGKSPGHS